MKDFDQLIKRTLHIDPHLLDDNVPDKSTLSVMVHELLHTCPDCVKHGYRWKKYALDPAQRNKALNFPKVPRKI